jgi:hypothetical protein
VLSFEIVGAVGQVRVVCFGCAPRQNSDLIRALARRRPIDFLDHPGRADRTRWWVTVLNRTSGPGSRP